MAATKDTKQQTFLRKILSDSFARMQKDHPNYSLRTFARKLGVSPAALSEMLKGKRLITTKTISKMLMHLDLSDVDREKLSKFEKSSKALKRENREFVQIDIAENPELVEWQYFAIMSLAVTADFNSDPQWISSRLNLPLAQVKKSLETLLRLHILTRLPDGKLEYNGASFKINTATQKQVFKKGHTQHLTQALNALDDKPSEQLDYSSMTMAIDPELLQEANEMIKTFRRRLAQFLGSGKNEEVYKLNIQLFPLTKRN